jgi:hypothetical protein
VAKIYLDVCCLNRPFDDQSQARIRLESEAVEIILCHIQNQEHNWIASDAVEYEAAVIPDLDRRNRVLDLVAYAHESVAPDEEDFNRARHLNDMGFKEMDSLHIACAEKAKCDVLLTTDDKMIRVYERHADDLQIQITNPLTWLNEAEPT